MIDLDYFLKNLVGVAGRTVGSVLYTSGGYLTNEASPVGQLLKDTGSGLYWGLAPRPP